MNSATSEPKFKTVSVRPAAHRNAEQAIAVQSLGGKGKKTSLVEFASEALNRVALPILKKANIEPASDSE